LAGTAGLVEYEPRQRAGRIPDGGDLFNCLAVLYDWSMVNDSPRKKCRVKSKPKLSVEQILEWADAHFKRTGRWPRVNDRALDYAPQEKWKNIDAALRVGIRDLPGGSSLAELLAQHRGQRNQKDLPSHTISQIVKWADSHHQRTGKWPNHLSGPVVDAPGETWAAIERALSIGSRGLPGGLSLARLLAKHRRVRNRANLPGLTIPQILTWAEVHRKHTGNLPSTRTGAVAGAPGETWLRIERALRHGRRGLSVSICEPAIVIIASSAGGEGRFARVAGLRGG